jgi:hypothetical protein
MRVYVYGDDIIVPSEWYHLAVEGLTLSGFAVNDAKSFYRGPFRESCGGDYLNGKDVVPVRLRLTNAVLPTPKHVTNLKLRYRTGKFDIFLVEMAKHAVELRKKLLTRTAEYYESLCRECIPMPFIGEDSSVLGVYTEDSSKVWSQGRYDPDLGYHVIDCATTRSITVRPTRLVVETRFSKQVPLSLVGAFLMAGFTVPTRKVIVEHLAQCPYKFLATKLKLRAPYLDESRSAQPHGDIPVPRDTRVVKQVASIMDLMPSRHETKLVLV